MMLLYLALLFVLVLARVLVWGRAKLLEKKFSRLARAASDLATPPIFKMSGGTRPDPYAFAKQQYLLGEVTAKRDLVEARHEAWQARSDKLARMTTRLRNWKGRTVPYLFGAVDAVLLSVVLTLLGMLELPTLTQLLEMLSARWRG